MSNGEEPRISVTLEESHWLAVIDIVHQGCQMRGGEWLRWSRYITTVIKDAFQRASERVGMPPPVAPEGVCPEPYYLGDVSAIHGEIAGQDHAVVIRRERARAMIRRGRRGTLCTLSTAGNRYVFQIQSTAEFKAGKWPLGEDEGYWGWIEIGPDDQIVAGECDCPDNEDERALLPNGVVYCKHMEFARLRVLKDGLDEHGPITLELGWDDGMVLERVKRNGQFREPETRDPNVARKWLVEHGYELVATETRPDGLVRMIYAWNTGQEVK